MKSFLPVAFIVITSLFICVCACNKNNAPSKNSVSTLQINYSGVPLPGKIVNFSTSNAPAGSKFLWDFGDGSGTSTDAAPSHIFNNTGTYTVTVAINNDPYLSLSQSVTIFSDPIYTYLIAGTKTWHHKIKPPLSAFGDTVYLADTSFTITELNPVAILIGADTLSYNNNFTGLLNFYHSYPVVIGSPYSISLNFDHSRNTIGFYKYYMVDTNNLTTTKVEVFQWP